MEHYRQQIDGTFTGETFDYPTIDGQRVRITKTFRNKGVKYEAGTLATVFWYGVDDFRTTRFVTYFRVGIKLDDGRKAFTISENIVPADLPEDVFQYYSSAIVR